jgi:hypothetical protein
MPRFQKHGQYTPVTVDFKNLYQQLKKSDPVHQRLILEFLQKLLQMSMDPLCQRVQDFFYIILMKSSDLTLRSTVLVFLQRLIEESLRCKVLPILQRYSQAL